ncbi:hypothetical protein [Nocardia rhizosphaerae]|uniref:Uncharacterized protein n=1 Tax=Nocardia rhizosphaerae TaxID=1691571 RepID=A0ABV8L7D6_9NOCA
MNSAESSAARTPKRRNLWILLGSAAGALIGLTLAGGGLAHLWTPSGTESRAVRLTEPDALQGIPRISDPATLGELAAVQRGYGEDVDSVVAIYGHSRTQPELLVHVVASGLKNPESNVELLLSDTVGTTPQDVTSIDAGPLGGIARCATAVTDQGPSALCSWVADNSFGKIVWVGVTKADIARDFVAIRSQLES